MACLACKRLTKRRGPQKRPAGGVVRYHLIDGSDTVLWAADKAQRGSYTPYSRDSNGRSGATAHADERSTGWVRNNPIPQGVLRPCVCLQAAQQIQPSPWRQMRVLWTAATPRRGGRRNGQCAEAPCCRETQILAGVSAWSRPPLAGNPPDGSDARLAHRSRTESVATTAPAMQPWSWWIGRSDMRKPAGARIATVGGDLPCQRASRR